MALRAGLLAAVTMLSVMMTACEKPGKVMEVAPFRSACIGAGPMECLRVRWQGEEHWRLFYNVVEGFEFEPGFDYVLRVQEVKDEKAPADGSRVRYQLVEVVSKTPVNQ